MSTPMPARSEMVETMLRILGWNISNPEEKAHLCIAAVLDNLPLAVMLRKIDLRSPCVCDRCKENMLDAAISAARREVLGHE